MTPNDPVVVVESAEGALLGREAISSHLELLGMSQKTVNNYLKCGQIVDVLDKDCKCGTRMHYVKHKCNLRTCPACSKRKKTRARSIYTDFFANIEKKIDKKNLVYFLTISPLNYDDLEDGLNHLKKSFSKFLRLDYIKERVKGGFYVIEVTERGKGWNVHLHAIVYGQSIDNLMRGYCRRCKRVNIIHKDPYDMKFYCANRKCLCKDVVPRENSKIVSLFQKSSKRDVNIKIVDEFYDKWSDKIYKTWQRPDFCVNYMLKYIHADKDSFSTPSGVARYIKVMFKRRLFASFGSFYKNKTLVQVKMFSSFDCFCPDCGERIVFSFNKDVSLVMRCIRNGEKPPPVFRFNGGSEQVAESNSLRDSPSIEKYLKDDDL